MGLITDCGFIRIMVVRIVFIRLGFKGYSHIHDSVEVSFVINYSRFRIKGLGLR